MADHADRTAAGVRRVLHPGRSGTWGPLLFGVNGLGLIVAGVFVTDPGAGYPPGAPAGAPEQLTWHGILHEVGFVLSSIGFIVGALVLVRRFATIGWRGWAAACVATVVAVLVVSAWPDLDSLSVRLVIATAISSGYVAVLAGRLTRGLPVSLTTAEPD